jgi:hypothetical protein
MSGYMFLPHRAVFRQQTLMETTARCPLMSIILFNVLHHYSQFWCFENVLSLSPYCGFSVPFVCTAPLVVCTLYWFDVPKIGKADIRKTSKLRIMTEYINEYYWHKRAHCSTFHQNVLPEDGPVRSKHVVRHKIYCTIFGVLDQFWHIIVRVTPLETPFGLWIPFITIPIIRNYIHSQLFLTLLRIYTIIILTRPWLQ